MKIALLHAKESPSSLYWCLLKYTGYLHISFDCRDLVDKIFVLSSNHPRIRKVGGRVQRDKGLCL